MATKADFTEHDFKVLQMGVTGAGLLVSQADKMPLDDPGEMRRLSKYLAEQRKENESALMREVAHVEHSGLLPGVNAHDIEAETIAALGMAVEILRAQAPAEVLPYKELVIGGSIEVAAAKAGVQRTESGAIDKIHAAFGWSERATS